MDIHRYATTRVGMVSLAVLFLIHPAAAQSAPTLSDTSHAIATVPAVELTANVDVKVDRDANSLAPKAPTERLTGFAEVPWNAPEDSVIAHHGRPDRRDELADRSASWFTYHRQLVGVEVEQTFLFTLKRGLVKGAYQFPMGPDCLQRYEKFFQAIQETYPGVKPRDDRYNKSSIDFCGGVIIGKATRMTTWEFPADSARIYIYLPLEGQPFGVHYEGPGFDAWDTANKQGERKHAF